VKRILTVSVAMGIAAGCGGRSDDTSPRVKLGDFPAAAARVFCENHGECCKSVGRPFNRESCTSKVEEYYTWWFGYSGPRADADVPGRCLDELASVARKCREWSPCPEVFEAASRGTKGEPCSGTCSRMNGSFTCQSDGSSGTPDDAPSCLLGDGLNCGESSTCEARVAIGQPCSTSFHCASGWCDSRNGSCGATLPEGADCNDRLGACGEGLVCQADGRVCNIPALNGARCTCTRKRPNGAACHDDRECADALCEGGRCDPAPPLSERELDESCSL
jgi:hypothetical protein